MCGFIAGFSAEKHGIRYEAFLPALERLRPRGPDAEGQWHDEFAFLGHRRLAILDLDSRATQPFVSGCGQYVLAYNGEIYNYRALRAELERNGVPLRTQSDTEVIVELFSREGPACLERLRGMFGFVIWNQRTREAYAVRDPYGIKPLYIAHAPKCVLVASQVKALVTTGLVARHPSDEGQAGYWMLGSVPEPHTWYRDIKAVPAGHIVRIANGKADTPLPWKNIERAWHTAQENTCAPEEVLSEVRRQLNESIQAHIVSDVPVGVFLSGGLDSATVAALMKEAGPRPVQGVTVSFREYAGTAQDETASAIQLARHIGIDHHVREVQREEFLEDLPRILSAMDQPSIDGINTWFASKAVAERRLKVVVSGIGGDELFQGYRVFRRIPRLVALARAWSSIPGMTYLIRGICRLQQHRTGNARWSLVADHAGSIPGAWFLQRSIATPLQVAELAKASQRFTGLHRLSPASWIKQLSGNLPADEKLAVAQLESTLYLRNQLLRDSDWSSMAHSVELRTPLVDSWLLDSLAPHLSAIGRMPGKSALVQSIPSPLPASFTRRRKTGFSIPVLRWITEAGLPSEGLPPILVWARKVATCMDN